MKKTVMLNGGLLLIALMAVGCNKPADTKPAAKDTGSAAPHTHGTGPNSGVVFDLGSHHAEFTVDHPKQQCTVLILGADEKTPQSIAATEFVLSIKEAKTAEGKVVSPMTITMKPTDAADGKATTFVGTDPGIGNVADFEGTISGEIDGKPASGKFKE